MKKRELQELKMKSAAELEKMLKDGKEKLRALKFDLFAGKVKNINELKRVKKDIARVLTIMNSRQENA